MLSISDFVEVRDKSVAKHYKKQKAAIGHFIEDYMNEKVDLKRDFKDLMKHKDEIFTYNYVGHHWKFFLSRFIPEVVIHSQKQDERIIRSHYDDKNDLFSWFLGDRMIYTSCYYKNENETLEQAQDNKLDLIAQKMQLKEGETLLDIGCGWGTLVTHFAKHYGVDCTGVTIAQAGADWANGLIKENGVEDKARILRMDYRDIPKKKYNKITCLEMAEHVGVKNFKKFMAQIHDMLEDDGIFYMQIAGLRERNSLFFDIPERQEDLVWGLFMNEYIFSGADASMPLNWDLLKMEKVGFEVHSIENIGIHYSKTIDDWYSNWMSNKEKVLAKYGEYTFRMYQIFLAWSVEIAAQGSSTAYQIVAYKNRNFYDRTRFIGGVSLGESDKFNNTSSVASSATKKNLVGQD